MFPRILTSLTLLFLNLSAAVAEVGRPTPGNPPTILIAAGIDDAGKLALVHYRTIYIQPVLPGGPGGPRDNERSVHEVSLQGVKIYDGAGKEMTIDAARKRMAGKDMPILVTSWEEKLSAFYRPLFRDDLIVFAFPKDAPQWPNIQEPSIPVR